MTLTILAEDHADPGDPGLRSDHGFSLHVELEDLNLLYDFGAKGTLIHNAEKLGINLKDVDNSILSHGHYDHADGLGDFLNVNSDAKVHHGRGAFHPRWSISRGVARNVGIAVIPTDEVVARMSVVDALIDNGSYVILPAAPGHDIRPAGNSALLSGPEGNRLQDDFTDELTLVLRGNEGLVVITGCSHRGILNIVDQVKTYCPDCPIKALIGGFHLIDGEETPERLNEIGERLREKLPGTRVITGHCTGQKSQEALSAIPGSEIETLHVGMVLKF